MVTGIYKIVCLDNGRFYVGSAVDVEKRWNRHFSDLRNGRHDNTHLQRSYDKYGEESFTLEIIEECDVDMLLIREQYYLDSLRPYENDIGFNIGKNSSGGDNLTNHPNREEIIERIKSTVLDGLETMGEEGRKLRWSKSGKSNPNYGNRWSDEMKEKASDFQKELYSKGGGSFSKRKGKTNIEVYGRDKAIEISKKLSECASRKTGQKNPFFGKTHSDETKDKIRQSRMGVKPTNRIMISIDGVIYESYREASDKLNIPVVTIRWRCLSDNVRFSEYKLI